MICYNVTMAGDAKNVSLKSLIFNELKFDLSEEEFRRLHLCYRGEGNDNLVLQAPNIRHVLRFRKSKSFVDVQEEEERLKKSFAYYYLFVEPLFSVCCSVPVIINVPELEVRKLDDSLFPQRPSYRREKRVFCTSVEIHPDYAFLLVHKTFLNLKEQVQLSKAPSSDLLKLLLSSKYLEYRDFVFTVLTDITFQEKIMRFTDLYADTLCVEIKPKQAWTASPDRRSICIYCMNQFYKLSTRKIRYRTEYCPLDLFSGNRTRMRKALLALMKEPQNNFKIFRNGKLVHGENEANDVNNVLREWFTYDSKSYVDIFCHLIEEALLLEFASHGNSIELVSVPYTKSREHVLCPNLNMEMVKRSASNNLQCLWEISPPENSILERILRLQQLDQFGIETVYDYYETHKCEFTSEFGYIDRLIVGTKVIDERIQVPALNVVDAYLFSIAAKDLSILITFKAIINNDEHSRNFVISDNSNKLYQVNVSVVDVGPKPISCIKKHWKRDAAILTAYVEHLYPECIVKT